MRHPLLIAFAAALAAAPLAAQDSATPDPTPLAAGATAPDFTLAGATRYGVLQHPIHLSDFRGKVVVLAFFYKARTKG